MNAPISCRFPSIAPSLRVSGDRGSLLGGTDLHGHVPGGSHHCDRERIREVGSAIRSRGSMIGERDGTARTPCHGTCLTEEERSCRVTRSRSAMPLASEMTGVPLPPRPTSTVLLHQCGRLGVLEVTPNAVAEPADTGGATDTTARGRQVGPDGGPRAVIWSFPGFNAPLSGFEKARLAVFVEAWERARGSITLLHVQAPGGPGPTIAHLTPPQRRHLAMGDFGPFAAECARALACLTPPGAHVHLLGYSMGASSAAATARLVAESTGHDPLHEIVLTGLTLVEPAALSRRNPFALWVSERHESRVTAPSLAANAPLWWCPDPEAGDAQRQRRGLRGIEMSLQGAALSRGRMRPDLAVALARTGPVPVDVVSGSASRLCPPASVDAFRRFLDTLGSPGRDTSVPGGTHALWHDLPLVAHLFGRKA